MLYKFQANYFTDFKLYKMRYLKKEFKTSRQAENYLNKLYGMYNHVRLIGFPPNSEAGTYIFEIK